MKESLSAVLGTLLVVIAALPAGFAAADSGAFRLPPGFVISEYSSDELAHDITMMTFDPKGRVVVSGPGYISTLHDTDNNGIADRAVRFASRPAGGAQGLCFAGSDLLVSGDRSIFRLRDHDGDGVADGTPEVLRADLDDREHGTHAIRQGPDGWFHVMFGNALVPGAYRGLARSSPVPSPRQGALLRFSPDFRTVEALADGFRNAYDFDFTAPGRLLTVDSDGERVHHLPGYAPTRMFDIAIGSHHGWMVRNASRSWSRPGYFVDTVERVVEMGRGSPTGVLVHRHHSWPERYRAGVFSACWSLGTIYFVPLTPRGATRTGELEVFLEATGNDGFAPVALAVSPEGDLFVAIGGRDTRGGVYRIRYAGPAADKPPAGSDLNQVLAADQPLSSWSRARWQPLARQLGVSAFAAAALDSGRPLNERVRAIEIMVEMFDGVPPAAARSLSASPEAPVVARLAWALGRNAPDPERNALLASLTRHPEAAVQHAAWEAALSRVAEPGFPGGDLDWMRGVGSPDRRVRSAAVAAARLSPHAVFSGEDPRTRLARLRLRPPVGTGDDWTRSYFETALALYEQASDPGIQLEAIQLIQIGLGDISETGDRPEWCDVGFNAARLERLPLSARQDVARALLARFPTGSPEMDWETSRLLGMLQVESSRVLTALAPLWTAESSPVDDLHYLAVAAQLPGSRPDAVLQATARTLALLHAKMDARGWLPSRFWPVQVAEIFRRLVRFDPRHASVLAEEAVFGRPEHSLFATLMEGAPRTMAARRMLAAAHRTGNWNPELLEFLAVALPPGEIQPALRAKAADPALQDSIAVLLARLGDPADRALLVRALGSTQTNVVRAVADALTRFADPTTADVTAAVRALARHETDHPTAAALQALLTRWTGGNAAGSARFADWLAWLESTHPRMAATLAGESAADPSVVLSRLRSVAWDTGRATQGKVVYQRIGCAACHDSARQGPDLTGIAARFGRDDLFRHIVHPNLAIAPPYRSVQINTRDGATHVGVPVYESPEATLLEVAGGAIVRVLGDDIVRLDATRRSPMPEGLLNGLSVEELADLYAFLRELK